MIRIRTGLALVATQCLASVYGVVWAQGATQAGVPATLGPAKEARSPELLEAPKQAPAPLLSTGYLSRVVSATKEPKIGSVIQQSSLGETIALLSSDDLEAAQQAWSECASDIAASEIPTDVELFILYILNRSYLQSNPDLLMTAEKVRFFVAQVEAVKMHIGGLRKHETVYKPDEVKETTIEEIVLAEFVPGGAVIRSALPEKIPRAELAPRIAVWERTLDLVSDETLIAQAELERAMAKQKTAMQAMSWASKMLHDVARQLLKGPK